MLLELVTGSVKKVFIICVLFVTVSGCQSTLKKRIKKDSTTMIKKIRYDKQVTDEWDDVLLEAPKVKTLYNPVYDFTVNTDTVIYIADKKRHAYNFLITRDKSGSGFENLVLNYEDGEYVAYLFMYDLISGESGNQYKSTRVRTLYDFDFSMIARKKPAPCHKLLNRPLQEESKPGSVIYSELIEVLDEKCLKQLKKKRQGLSGTKQRTLILSCPVYKK